MSIPNAPSSRPSRLVLASREHPVFSNYAKQYDIAKREFEALRDLYTRKTYDNREFILVGEVTKRLRLKSQSCQGELVSDLQRLLIASHHSSSLPPPELSLDELEEYLGVFYILIDLGCPQLIGLFSKQGMKDEQLPITKLELLEKIKAEEVEDVSEFHARFFAQQYRWCPVTFDIGMCTHFNGRIVPICEKAKIKPQDDPITLDRRSTMWRIDVPEELVSPELQQKVPFSRIERETTGRDGKDNFRSKYYQFALKEFVAANRNKFYREKIATNALKHEDGIVQYFGWYQTSISADDSSDQFFNIVLELGEMDFYRAIMKRGAPLLPDEICSFWATMLDIACTLRSIHQLIIDNTPYTGCHGDIKPENILLINGRFKLCDSGEARIEVATSSNNFHTTMTGGTLTYASPEKSFYWSNREQIPEGSVPQISSKSDVWSLGCVLSVAATYVVLGPQGVIMYDQLRQKANVKRNNQLMLDCFHDGTNVLPEVIKWHKYLRKIARRTDMLTGGILDLVEEHILLDSDNRVDSGYLCKHLTDTLGEHDNFLEPLSTDLIDFVALLDDLEEADHQRAPHSTRSISTDSSRDDSGGMYSTTPLSGRGEPIAKSKVELLSQSVQPTIQRTQLRQAREMNPTRQLPRPPSNLYPIRVNTSRSVDTLMPYSASLIGPSVEEPQNERNIYMVQRELEDLQREKTLLKLLNIRRNESVREKKKQSYDELGGFYNNRDIVFLVDNGSTMREHWLLATEVIKTLVWRALGYDEDGMELYFTDRNCKESVKQNKNQTVSNFVTAMKRAEPKLAQPSEPTEETGILIALQRIVTSYNEKWKPKPKTIIILTDAIWTGLQADDAVETLIKSQMKQKGWTNSEPSTSSSRPITYQFVRFGRDPVGIERLRRLDDDLAKSGYPDFVDTEPALGDVYKIFLGSLCPDMDTSKNFVNMQTTSPHTSLSSSDPRSPVLPSPEHSRSLSFSGF